MAANEPQDVVLAKTRALDGLTLPQLASKSSPRRQHLTQSRGGIGLTDPVGPPLPGAGIANWATPRAGSDLTDTPW